MSKFLSLPEAAREIGLHPKTLEKQLRDGRVPACSFAQSSPRAPYRISAEAVRFFGQACRWPEHRRELQRFSQECPAPTHEQPTEGLEELRDAIKRLCEQTGVPVEAVLHG